MPLTTRDLVSLRVDIMKNKKKYDRDKVVAGVASALAMLIGAVSVFYGFSLDHITICNCPIELPGQAPCYCIGHGYFDMTFFCMDRHIANTLGPLVGNLGLLQTWYNSYNAQGMNS